MICGPNGIMTIKSMMTVNCVSASSQSRRRSCFVLMEYIGKILEEGKASRGAGDEICEVCAGSVVEVFVHRCGALFPVACRTDARFVDAALGV